LKIFYSPECLKYKWPGHPESPERIENTADFLESKGYVLYHPESCTDEDILRVHSMQHWEAVIHENFIEYDTPAFPQISHYARLAAGSAIDAMESALYGETAFSLMRPPGHHATRERIMAVCYINNMAIAVAHFLNDHPELKACILDIDCHHGNGTQDIFLGNEFVLYISLHQSPFYPGTGYQSQDNCLNYPLPPGSDDALFLLKLKEAVAEIVNFGPRILGISAGFDTFSDDPLTQLFLSTSAYHTMGKTISDLNLPTFMVMEGGYSSQLPECVYQFLQGFNS